MLYEVIYFVYVYDIHIYIFNVLINILHKISILLNFESSNLLLKK